MRVVAPIAGPTAPIAGPAARVNGPAARALAFVRSVRAYVCVCVRESVRVQQQTASQG